MPLLTPIKHLIEDYSPNWLLGPVMKHMYRQKDTQLDGCAETRFTQIYQSNAWGDSQSASGPGSTLEAAANLSQALPGMCKSLNVKTFVDVPCGDCNWISHVDLGVDHYIGGDIVRPLVESHQQRFQDSSRSFKHVNLISDPIPAGDLLMVRDCLIHLSFHDIDKVLKNIARSDVKYLLTTTYPNKRRNWDIKTGGFRPINLQLAPFNLPDPLEMIDDNAGESPTTYQHFMALWKVSDLRTMN